MKSSFGVHLAYDHVFSWAAIITTCAIVVDVHCTIFVWVESVMITFIKGPKTISSDKDIHSLSGVAKEKVGDLSLNMCSIL
jgi:hypothetical protein